MGRRVDRRQAHLVFTSDHVDSDEYQGVLQDSLLPFLRRFRRRGLRFQQDGASTHTSASTRDWLEAENVDVIDWPPRSPDLNMIKNVWGTMARIIYTDNKAYTSIAALKRAIEAAWPQIKQPYIKKLIDSMPNRVYEVIERRGNATHY